MSTISNFEKEKLGKGLGLFIDAMRDYVQNALTNTDGAAYWHERYYNSIGPQQQANWNERTQAGSSARNLIDFGNLPVFVIKNKELFKNDFKKDVNKLVTWLDDIAAARNAYAHHDDLSDDAATKAWINMTTIAKTVDDADLVTELKKLREEKESVGPAATTSVSGPQPWFRHTTPHLDIKQGRLDESVFAANLAEVALESGASIYSNRELFFAKTYPTQGLKTIARRVIQGLNGNEDAENRVISLQTGFGGGKTHTLISLYHLSKWGKNAASSRDAANLVAATGVPEFESANVAVFTNTTNDPANGRNVDGVHIRTLWGELAYQLGGKDAFKIVRKNDEEMIAPAGLFKMVLEQCRPALILIDELADYCVKAAGVMVGKVSLADQTISFMQELTEAVAGTAQCVVVVTLPASPQEVGNTEVAQNILSSLQKRVSRVGADTQPVADDEVYEVIRRRLFEDIGNEAGIQAAVDEYMSAYLSLLGELPSHVHKSEYRQKMLKAYPFHPELIDVFRIRWASNHDFQRTRGVLRLLAAIVSDLWKRQQSLPGGNLLIHPSDINIGSIDALSGQLKRLYGNGWAAVIDADVSGSSSNAFRIDSDKKEYGDWNLATGIASVILMNSFGADGANKGLSIADIKLQVVRPNGFNHNSVHGALDALENTAHYLYYSSGGQRRYWFHTTPNINILINTAKSEVSSSSIEVEVINRLKIQTNNLPLFKVIVAPEEDIAEQTRPALVILNPKYAANPDSINGNTKPLVEKLATKKGSSERIYRNTMLFLVCSEVGYGKLQSSVRDYLACEKISKDYNSQLEKEQRDEIKRKIEDASRSVNTSLIEAYSILLKHSAKSGTAKLLVKEFASTMEKQIGDVILNTLKTEEWLLDTVGLGTLRKQNLLPELGKPIRAKDVYEAFVRYDDKPMIRDISAVQNKLADYSLNGEFGIASGDGKNFNRYYYKQPVMSFDVTDETFWLVHSSDMPAPATTSNETGTGSPTPTTTGSGDNTNAGIGSQEPPSAGYVPTARSVSSIQVSGKVGLNDYAHIFSSFIQPMLHNDVEIEIRIKAKSTARKPLTESSQEYKIAKESARQLGLVFEEE